MAGEEVYSISMGHAHSLTITMHLKAAAYTIMLVYLLNSKVISAASDSITTPRILKDSETLISTNADFKLGFFNPNGSTIRYCGIWFNRQGSDNTLEIIWVANRNNPVKDSTAMLKILNDGNLQVTDKQNTIYWSSNVSSKANSSVAQLLDTGNLILVPNGSDDSIWQSFDHLTDSLLPGVKLTLNKSVHDPNINIWSWKSSNDPSSGRFRIVSLPRDLPEFFVLDGEKPYWRSGPWNGYLFLGVPYVHSEVSFGFNVDDHVDTVDISYELPDKSLLERFVVTYDGNLCQKIWMDSSNNWETTWQSLQSECDVYGKCGAFAVCNPRTRPTCECLKGFTPKKIDEWSKGNWTNGCARRTELQCRVAESKVDKFLHLKNIKVPDFAHWILADQEACQSNCLRECSCLAYSYYSGIGCMFWNESLVDVQQFSADGADLFIRLANSDLPDESGRRKTIIAVTVISGAFVCIISIYCLWKWTGHRFAKRATTPPKGTQWQNIFGGAPGYNNDFQDLPLFEFTKLAAATNEFSVINKLGQGGFGPVYRGKLEDGQDIAVKRLSRASGQGLEEFMNEVLMISKLQHKNLVRLLGCCVEGEEKLLVYELLPNKSLDALLFDPDQRNLLDWQRRFSIIRGICRGLLYLHRDSRLRIIHRDLKPSNILLDEELSPKISDFGMARIFDSKQDQASTNRVVGTYGYMSPEYALEGRFSEKSDVFSFGVLLLEIVSGRKNHRFPDNQSVNLLTYTWNLWNQNDMHSLIDPAVLNRSFESQIFKCIQVGLLCVQEFPEDRPDVPSLISMLDDAINVETLPIPKQPGFTRSKACSSDGIVTSGHEQFSEIDASLTALSGR